MRKVVWTINFLSTPTITRHCKKCNRDMEFSCSERFRINAQGKYLDVWLIYNCKKCKTSWNSTIFSRVHTNKMDQELLALFQNNDPMLARQYGSDRTILNQNGVTLRRVEYEILGERFELDEPVILEIQSDFPLKIKLFNLLKAKLDLSTSELKQFLKEGAIQGAAVNCFKKKVHESTTIIFNQTEELIDS